MDVRQEWLDAVHFDAAGLVPVVTQDAATARVLMLAWMNRAALERTLADGVAVYWSRSRGRLWVKGERSGHTQRVVSIRLDCDADAILLEVEQLGGICCHTGRQRCFHLTLDQGMWTADEPVLRDPEAIYGNTEPS